jgi:hypothetical protein
MARVAANFANIQNVLLQCLSSDRPHLADISSICELSRYSGITGRGHLPLLDHIPQFLHQAADHKLEAHFIIEELNGWSYWSSHNANQLIDQALKHFKHFHDPDMQCELISEFSLCSLS